MKSQLSTNHLRKIRKALPHGSIKKIADDLNLDISTVSKVLQGNHNNNSIIDAALNIIEEGKKSAQVLDQRINSI